MTEEGSAPVAPVVPMWRRVLPFVVATALLVWVFSTIDWGQFVAAIERTNILGYAAFGIVFGVVLLLADAFATASVYRATIAEVITKEIFVVRGASYLPTMVNYHLGIAWMTWFMAKVKGASLWRMSGRHADRLRHHLRRALRARRGRRDPRRRPRAGARPDHHRDRRRGGRLPRRARVEAELPHRAQAALAALRDRRDGPARALLPTAPHVAVLFVGTWVPFEFFGVHIPVAEAFALIPVLMFVLAFPIAPQGFGTRDAVPSSCSPRTTTESRRRRGPRSPPAR